MQNLRFCASQFWLEREPTLILASMLFLHQSRAPLTTISLSVQPCFFPNLSDPSWKYSLDYYDRKQKWLYINTQSNLTKVLFKMSTFNFYTIVQYNRFSKACLTFFNTSHKKIFKGAKSGELAVHSTGTLRSIHCSRRRGSRKLYASTS